MIPSWALSAPSEVSWVFTSMPSTTVIVQDAWGFIRPGGPCICLRLPSGPGMATSTRHCRQAPTGASSGWSQNRGI